MGNVFGNKINWKTIHAGLIDNWDLSIIYKLIHQVIAVRKKSIPLEDRAHARMSCMPFSIARKLNISLNT